MAEAAQQTEGGRREDILEAAQTIFSHYGYRRASLEQIANEAGMSRTGLYHHFRSKEEVFRAMAERLHALTHAAAEVEAAAKKPITERLARMLEAKFGWFFDRLAETRHGNEILDESNRLCGDLTEAGSQRFLELLEATLEEAEAGGELSFEAAGTTAAQTASFLSHCAWGLQGYPGAEPPSPAEYGERLERLARTIVASMRARRRR